MLLAAALLGNAVVLPIGGAGHAGRDLVA